MTTRPSQRWRDGVAREAQALAAGTLEPEYAYMTRLFPESLLQATDTVLDSFEADVRALPAPEPGDSTDGAGATDATDKAVFAAIERVVLQLNAVNEEHGGGGYETGEREELCEFIDRTLVDAGIDIYALAGRRGVGVHELTDEWRDW